MFEAQDPMTERDVSLPQRLEAFLRSFRSDFRRREQADWAAVYVQGLLHPGGRKTIESLARTVTLPAGLRVEDVTQALLQFINQSPWDEQKLWRRYHRRLAEGLEPASGLFVLDEFAFHKQGRHSVGVQRQYSAALGGKTNCQVAVSLHHAGASACLPLALRLYLPRRWTEDPSRLDSAGVPEPARHFVPKTAIALQLLDDARATGIPARAVAPGPAWGGIDGLPRAVEERGLTWLQEVPPELADSVRRMREDLHNELGLDHFEGRSWRGFHHHVCLVLLAFGFRASLLPQSQHVGDQ
jgi:SRSO17 transposase